MSLLRQLLTGMSMRRYLPAMGTAGSLRFFVRGYRRVPRPPPRITLRTSCMGEVLSGGKRAWRNAGRRSRQRCVVILPHRDAGVARNRLAERFGCPSGCWQAERRWPELALECGGPRRFALFVFFWALECGGPRRFALLCFLLVSRQKQKKPKRRRPPHSKARPPTAG